MNLLHLKYAVEVEKSCSISKAAENLFMGQPNLSRAIKELEESIGTTIFKRTSKGIYPTPQGEEFLQHAKSIVAQIDEIEEIYQSSKNDKHKFSVSVPRASYIASAFTEFSKSLDLSRKLEVFYKETNSMTAINNIIQSDYRLGIIRYQSAFESYFKSLLDEKSMDSELILEFSYLAVMSVDHPLAKKSDLELNDLNPYIEIAHADPFVPSMPVSVAKKAELSDRIDKRIFVFERASQFDLLSSNFNTFMWVSPIPQRFLEQYGLVQKKVRENTKTYKDILIYRKAYHFSDLDDKFIHELKIARDTAVCNN